MAILFDWYENPVSPDQPKKKRFHPRIAYNGQVDTDEMRSKIQSRCTLNEVDVTAVLDALSQVMGEELGEGRQVHLDGIGYFYPTLTATEEIAADTPRRNMKIKLKAIRFRSDQKLKNSIGLIKVKQLKKNFHSSKLSEVEIDILLKEYFSTHQMMQRRDFQSLCGMVRSTAMIHGGFARKESCRISDCVISRSMSLFPDSTGHPEISRRSGDFPAERTEG